MKLPTPVVIPDEFASLKTAIEKCLAKVRQSKPTVQQVKKNLDALRDGIRTLKLFSSELQDDLVKKVNDASSVLEYQTKQLETIEFDDPSYVAAVDAIRGQLKTERPWLDIGEIDSDVAARQGSLSKQTLRASGWQEEQTELARGTRQETSWLQHIDIGAIGSRASTSFMVPKPTRAQKHLASLARPQGRIPSPTAALRSCCGSETR